MTPSKTQQKDVLMQWQLFETSLSEHFGDSSYNQMIREKGLEVKHMYFEKNKILFSIITTHLILIPYTILGGGYNSCMNYIKEEISCHTRLLEPQGEII
ncbi:hypothetical protein ACFPVY_02275 [Flavobacterium qiangtangense]|uniref:Uncharacterized protein n=1 Tax=Flavobacterium qiangtangense TaxID=1442595 RepID=A0ABW1PKJ4_9FLAO